VIPPQASAEFVAAMEDLLALFAEPHEPQCPVVCLDETPVGLLEHVREPLPARPGRPRREDHEYRRQGSACVFAALDLKGGRRLLEVRERRTGVDFALFVRRVVDELCPQAGKVRLVLDNLNTHTLGSLYKAFPPHEARRIAQRLELRFTPRHGSWLNPVELELAALKRQCLDRRTGSLQELAREVGAWQHERNQRGERVRWTFGLEQARERLARLYPIPGEDE